jgi:RNA polymerase sigma-70 factor (ECF subfamily)
MLKPAAGDRLECSEMFRGPTNVRPTPIQRQVPEPEASDQELLAAVRRGDGSSAQLLYDRLQPAIDHALRRVLRRRSIDFDDLIQVTFERIIRAIIEDRFAGQSRLTTWAAAIAGHVAIDFLRRSVREQRLFSTVEPPDSVPAGAAGRPAAEQRLEARSQVHRLHTILAKMKPTLAETVLLYDVLGHSLEEVAALTGVSQSAAQSRLFRGRKELLRRAGAMLQERRA